MANLFRLPHSPAMAQRLFLETTVETFVSGVSSMVDASENWLMRAFLVLSRLLSLRTEKQLSQREFARMKPETSTGVTFFG